MLTPDVRRIRLGGVVDFRSCDTQSMMLFDVFNTTKSRRDSTSDLHPTLTCVWAHRFLGMRSTEDLCLTASRQSASSYASMASFFVANTPRYS